MSSQPPDLATPHGRLFAHLTSIGRADDAPFAAGFLDLTVALRGSEEGALPIALVAWMMRTASLPEFIIHRMILSFARTPLEHIETAMVGVLDNQILWVHCAGTELDQYLSLPDFNPIEDAEFQPSVSLIFSIGAVARKLEIAQG